MASWRTCGNYYCDAASCDCSCLVDGTALTWLLGSFAYELVRDCSRCIGDMFWALLHVVMVFGRGGASIGSDVVATAFSRSLGTHSGTCDVVQVAPRRVSPSLYSTGLLENLLHFAVVSMRPSCFLVVSLFACCRASHSMFPPGALVLLWVRWVIGECSLSFLCCRCQGYSCPVGSVAGM